MIQLEDFDRIADILDDAMVGIRYVQLRPLL
jgi:hypothetical protein